MMCREALQTSTAADAEDPRSMIIGVAASSLLTLGVGNDNSGTGLVCACSTRHRSAAVGAGGRFESHRSAGRRRALVEDSGGVEREIRFTAKRHSAGGLVDAP